MGELITIRDMYKVYNPGENEVRALGIITTHYDATIFELFSQIHSNKVSANDIYLPLLFLIR